MLKTSVELESFSQINRSERGTNGGAPDGTQEGGGQPVITTILGGNKHIRNGTLRLGTPGAMSLDSSCKGVTFTDMVFLGMLLFSSGMSYILQNNCIFLAVLQKCPPWDMNNQSTVSISSSCMTQLCACGYRGRHRMQWCAVHCELHKLQV